MSKTGGVPERIEVVAKHVPYEITMFRLIYQRLRCEFDLHSTANIFIEGFALHARNLIDFFWDDLPPNAKDAVARHFTDTAYVPFNGVNPKTAGAYAKINKQISHITYDRTDLEQNKLEPQDRKTLYDLIENEIQNFACHVRAPYKEPWQRATHAPKVSMPAPGADRFIYEIGQSGPFTATVSTVPTTVVGSYFSPEGAEEGG